MRAQQQLNNNEAAQGFQQTARQPEPGGMRATQPGSFEQQLEAARRANDVKKMLLSKYIGINSPYFKRHNHIFLHDVLYTKDFAVQVWQVLVSRC